jgi:hypothetical protein
MSLKEAALKEVVYINERKKHMFDKTIIEYAWDKRVDYIEVEGSVIKELIVYLELEEIKKKYSRYEIDDKFIERIFIYFDWDELKKEPAV